MPLILEDGTGLPGANSYASVEEADLYFLTHPYYSDNWDALGDPDRERLLVAASSQLDALINWRGSIRYSNQALGWPRVGVVDDEGRVIPTDIVPQRVKTAVFELAFSLSRGDQYAPSSSSSLERLKIDVIELQFAGSTTITPVPAPALLALRGLGEYAFSSRVRRVLVG
jgi:hypothetical protein